LPFSVKRKKDVFLVGGHRPATKKMGQANHLHWIEALAVLERGSGNGFSLYIGLAT